MVFIRDWGYYDDEDDYFREDVPDIDTDTDIDTDSYIEREDS